MKKSNEHSLREVIGQLLDAYKLRDKLNEVTIHRTWGELMGPSVEKRTSNIRVQQGKLHISITSAPLRQELLFQRETIRERMNDALGGNYISEVFID